MTYRYAMFFNTKLDGKLDEAVGSNSYLPLPANRPLWRNMDAARDHAAQLNKSLNKGYKAFQIRQGSKYRPFTNYSNLTPVMELD